MRPALPQLRCWVELAIRLGALHLRGSRTERWNGLWETRTFERHVISGVVDASFTNNQCRCTETRGVRHAQKRSRRAKSERFHAISRDRVSLTQSHRPRSSVRLPLEKALCDCAESIASCCCALKAFQNVSEKPPCPPRSGHCSGPLRLRIPSFNIRNWWTRRAKTTAQASELHVSALQTGSHVQCIDATV